MILSCSGPLCGWGWPQNSQIGICLGHSRVLWFLCWLGFYLMTGSLHHAISSCFLKYLGFWHFGHVLSILLLFLFFFLFLVEKDVLSFFFHNGELYWISEHLGCFGTVYESWGTGNALGSSSPGLRGQLEQTAWEQRPNIRLHNGGNGEIYLQQWEPSTRI